MIHCENEESYSCPYAITEDTMDEIDTPKRHFSLHINSKIIRRVAADMEAQIHTAKNSFCCPRSCPKIPQHPFMKRSSPAKHPVTSWAAGPWWVARWTRHPRAETTLHTFSPGLEGAEEHGWSRSWRRMRGDEEATEDSYCT